MIQRRCTKAGEARYLVRLFRGHDPVSGKKTYAFKTFKTRKEAQRWQTAQQRALDTGAFVEPSQIRLSTYLSEWLEGPVKLNSRSRTLSDCRELIGRYLAGHELGIVPLARLTTGALERFYAELSARPLSARTVRMVHGVLHAALAIAARDRLIVVNPAAGATLPRQARTEMHALDAAQVRRLLTTSEATNNRWHALWHLLVNGGLRPSEALGLRWSDVVADCVHIRRTLVVFRKGGGWALEEPKTRRSRRVLTLPAITMQALVAHRGQQEIEKITAGNTYQGHDFVFAGQNGAPLSLANVTTRYFKPLLKGAGLPAIRLYDLRHTHASLLLAAGVPVHVVSARLGHASAKMTLDVYAHVLNGQQEDAIAKLELYMAAGRE
jgi:integrase